MTIDGAKTLAILLIVAAGVGMFWPRLGWAVLVGAFMVATLFMSPESIRAYLWLPQP